MKISLVSVCAACCAVSVFAQSGLHQTGSWPIGGEGGWDYVTVDSANHRLYVSHSTEVDILDTSTGKMAGKITGLKGVHGIAIAPEFNRGFITNGQAGVVTVFDTKTMQKVGDDVPAGKNPDGVIYDAATRKVFVMNGSSRDVTVIDAQLGTATDKVALGGKPEAAAVIDMAIFINLEDKNSVARVDARKLLVEQNWPTAPCESPAGMASDASSHRLFVGCHNNMMAVIDSNSGKVVSTSPICTGVDATVFDSSTKMIYNSCGDGTVTITKQDSADAYTVVETLNTQAGARTMALNTSTHEIYLPIAKFEEPTAVQAAGQRPRRSIVPGSFQILVFGK